VVGFQPELDPGESHEYESLCPIDTDWGTMEGSYEMQDDKGNLFDIKIGRFYLAVTSDETVESS
jgi:ApaG protein